MELEDEFAFLEEGDIVMSAAKHKQKTGFSPAAVIVITRREIEESGATTLMELLRQYPAVDVYEVDPLFPTAEIRGSLRVMLLLDGREINLDMFVSPFYQMLPVALADIERIEIVLGPNSALYGANAVSAVINVVTRRPQEDLHAEAWLTGGEHGGLNLSGRVGGGLGPLVLQATVGHERSDFWMQRDVRAEDILRATGTLHYQKLVESGKRITEYPNLLLTGGGTLRFDFGLTVHLAYTYVGPRDSDVRDPHSLLGPLIYVEMPKRHYLMGSLMQTFELGQSRLSAGLTFFNLFSYRYRESPGVITNDGSNYGGEILSRRLMLTARLVY